MPPTNSKIFFPLFFLFCLISLSAQHKQFVFERITTEEGLTQNNINFITQDDFGSSASLMINAGFFFNKTGANANGTFRLKIDGSTVKTVNLETGGEFADSPIGATSASGANTASASDWNTWHPRPCGPAESTNSPTP